MLSSTSIFSERSRVNRLLGVLAERPDLIGLGIDEGTAFILQGNEWSVVGRSYVIACEVDKTGRPVRFESFGDGDHGHYHAPRTADKIVSLSMSRCSQPRPYFSLTNSARRQAEYPGRSTRCRWYGYTRRRRCCPSSC